MRADFCDSDSFFENEVESDAEHPGIAGDDRRKFGSQKRKMGSSLTYGSKKGAILQTFERRSVAEANVLLNLDAR